MIMTLTLLVLMMLPCSYQSSATNKVKSHWLLYLFLFVELFLVCFPTKYFCFRFENRCETVYSHKMVEEKRPICHLELLKNLKSGSKRKQIMKCKLGMKKMKKYYPEKKCRRVGVGEERRCVDMVKLQEEKHEVKKCSFHPKTLCLPVSGMKCKKVKRKMCNYIDGNQL